MNQIRQKTKHAMAAHKAAAKALIEAVRKEYPVGSCVYVEVSRRATVILRITGHSDSWWHDLVILAAKTSTLVRLINSIQVKCSHDAQPPNRSNQ